MQFFICCAVLILSSQASAEVFTIQPKDQLVSSSSTATITFSCEANLKNPEYSWNKDSVALDTSDGSRYLLSSGTLQIKNPQPSDAGLYQCIVSGDEGAAASNYGRLTFASVSPFTKQEIEPVNAHVGSGAVIPCLGANYTPEKSVVFFWMYDDLRIVKPPGNSTHYISQKDGTLYLSHAKLSDANKLYCHARSIWLMSDGGRASEKSPPTTLTVSSSDASLEPEFILRPKDVIGMLGGKVLIECFAQGNPVPALAWFKDGGSLPSNSTVTQAGQLFLYNITEDMAGTYTCRASNSEGKIEGSSVLTLQYKPQWIQEALSKSADLLGTVTLRCQATGAPAPSYSWRKNGQALLPSNKFLITSDAQGSELDINNLDSDDAGMYQCVATNSHGTIFSNAAVTVKSYRPVFEKAVADVTKALVGKTAKIVVDVSSAPQAAITWKKEGIDISMDGSAFSMEPSGTLVIRNVSQSHEGTYICSAQNILGAESSEGYLDVFEATVITENPVDAELVAGDARELYCKAHHDPELTMAWKWKQDGVDIPRKNPHYDLSQPSSLLLLDVTSEQTGTYGCCAVTDAEAVCGYAEVVVTAPPDPPTDVAVVSSTATSQLIKWSVPNDNEANITRYSIMGKHSHQTEWVVMKTNPANVTSPPCNVINLLPFNTYSYKVSARNKIGVGRESKESTGATTLEGMPLLAPSGVSGGGGVRGQLVVTWDPLALMYYGAAKVDYHVGVQKRGDGVPIMIDPMRPDLISDSGEPWVYTTVVGSTSSEAMFEVDESEIFVPYQAKVRATNLVGPGPYSPLSLVYTAELAPTTAPDGFKTKWTLAYSAGLQWNPLENKNGFTKGYHVRICSVMETADCKNAAGHWINATSPNAKPEVDVEGLKPKFLYKVSIAGFNSGGMGPWSDWEDSMFTAAGPPPDVAPSGVKFSVTGQSLVATWKEVSIDDSIKGYKVQYWLLNETSKELKGKATGGTSLTLRLPRKTDYNVWVRAYNKGGDGRPTAPVVVSGQGGTVAKYEGGSAVVPRMSIATIFSAAILWSVVHAML